MPSAFLCFRFLCSFQYRSLGAKNIEKLGTLSPQFFLFHFKTLNCGGVIVVASVAMSASGAAQTLPPHFNVFRKDRHSTQCAQIFDIFRA